MSKNTKYSLPALGVDVLSDQTKLDPQAVRSAVNIDIGSSGAFSRRAGFTLRVAGDGYHSAYYAPQKGWFLVAQGNVLYRMDPTTYALTAMHTLATADPLNYTEYNGNLYFSSVSSFGWVPSDSTASRNVGVQKLDTPILSVAAGGLDPGKYAVVVTLVDNRGEEGPASDVTFVELTAVGGIRLAGLPTFIGQQIYIYITSADGDALRFAEAIPAVYSTYVVGQSAAGGGCDTQFLAPLTPGAFVRWHNGRLLTAAFGTLCFSEALRPHLYHPAHGVIPFSGYIAFVESVGDGLFVGDSRGVWFLAGTDPTNFKPKLVSQCRAVPRSSIMVPPEHLPEEAKSDEPVAVWLSTSGYVVGASGGKTTELHPDRIKVPSGLTGRSAFLLRGGRKQVVTPVNSTSAMAAGIAVDSVIP